MLTPMMIFSEILCLKLHSLSGLETRENLGLSFGRPDLNIRLPENIFTCPKLLYYGAGIWGTKEHKKLNTVQNKAARMFLEA